jgi:hypothetical protein
VGDKCPGRFALKCHRGRKLLIQYNAAGSQKILFYIQTLLCLSAIWAAIDYFSHGSGEKQETKKQKQKHPTIEIFETWIE